MDLIKILGKLGTLFAYRIFSYRFRGNYSFLNFVIVGNSNSCHNIYFINRIFAAETIQGRKLFKGGNYMSKYGIHTEGFLRF